MTLTKAELTDLLFEKVGFNKREAKDMVESFFEDLRSRRSRRNPAASSRGLYRLARAMGHGR